ncbi:MAG: PQQ-binding-like beta-propeller repeat protein [bacterium]|nr:PQQ-binding-like beta-propeller repeat protein [bacterium]
MRLRILVMITLAVATACSSADGTTTAGPASHVPTTTAGSTTSVQPSAPTTAMPTTTAAAPTTSSSTTIAPAAVGVQYGEIAGLTMFRGNPTRTFHGTGPVPQNPAVLWRFPDAAMCGTSRLSGEDKVWCGTGWTGQPVVWERPDGITEVIFGAFDKRVHFLNAATGERTRPDFVVGDIVKGSVVLDPDGFPLLYVGSRVSRYMVIALDRDVPTEIWSLHSDSVNGRWNNDWDASAVIVDDYLLEGGENSWWFAVKLNRSIGADGLVSVDPEVTVAIPAWTDELLREVGNQQSIESSTAVFESTAYFGTGAGRVVGVDLSQLAEGTAEIVLDFWAGDDIDSTIVIDDEGMLYVNPQVDLATARAAELGQLLKLNPSRPDDPLVWGLHIRTVGAAVGGAWATPALGDGILYLPTNPGELLAVDTTTGEVVWRDDIGFHAWSSPLLVDDVLVVSVNCGSVPALRAYDLADPQNPQPMWELPVSQGCLESTPAMWNGRLYVGSRDGYFYAIGDP